MEMRILGGWVACFLNRRVLQFGDKVLRVQG